MRTFRAPLLAACAAVTLSTTTHASTSLGSWGLWEAARAPDSCFIRTVSADTHWKLLIGAHDGDRIFQVALASDKLPANTARRMTVQADTGPVWSANADQVSITADTISAGIAPESARDFVHQITAGAILHVIYGNGGIWDVNLSGTTGAWAPLMDCVKVHAPAVVASLAPAQTTPTLPVVSSATTEVPITWTGGGYQTLATLNGVASIFTVDSGATAITIPQDLADRLIADGSLTPADLLGSVTVGLADGSKHVENRYMLHSVTLGGRTVHDVECLVGPSGTSPLLGQTFLLRFQSWAVDNARGVLMLGAAIS